MTKHDPTDAPGAEMCHGEPGAEVGKERKAERPEDLDADWAREQERRERHG